MPTPGTNNILLLHSNSVVWTKWLWMNRAPRRVVIIPTLYPVGLLLNPHSIIVNQGHEQRLALPSHPTTEELPTTVNVLTVIDDRHWKLLQINHGAPFPQIISWWPNLWIKQSDYLLPVPRRPKPNIRRTSNQRSQKYNTIT